MMFTIFLDSLKDADLVYSYFINSKNNSDLSAIKSDFKVDFVYSNIESFSIFFTDLIINIFEKKLIMQIFKKNYCYFSSDEQFYIFKESKIIVDADSDNRRKLIHLAIYDYVKFETSMNLFGFINFRLKDYVEVLEYLVDLSVNNFIINREYQRFINSLKDYVCNTKSKIDIVHLVYLNNESILLDQHKNIIPFDDHIFDAKYLSDISFSSNDFCLNTLLNVLPYKVYVHTSSGIDSFLDTLKKVFGKRISFCNSCDICTYYCNRLFLCNN